MSVLLRWSQLVAQGYILLLTVAAGGFVGANFVGVLAGAWTFGAEQAPDPAASLWWMHLGWTVGAGLFFIGAIGKTVHSIRKGGRARKRWLPQRSRSAAHGFRVTVGGRPCGIAGSIGAGGLLGAFLGLLLGASFLLLWFSIAYSPFAPGGWASTISVKTIGPEHAPPRDRAVTTDHPLAWYAFAAPGVVGALAGAILAGTGTAVQMWKDSHAKGPMQ